MASNISESAMGLDSSTITTMRSCTRQLVTTATGKKLADEKQSRMGINLLHT